MATHQGKLNPSVLYELNISQEKSRNSNRILSSPCESFLKTTESVHWNHEYTLEIRFGIYVWRIMQGETHLS